MRWLLLVLASLLCGPVYAQTPTPKSQAFTITSTTASVTPSQMFAADDTPSSIMITPFWVGTPPMGPFQPLLKGQTCSWTGDSIVQAFAYTYPGDGGGFPTSPSTGAPLSADSGERPCVLISSRQFTTADDGTHTGTMTVGGHSVAFTLHVGPQPTGPTPGGNINNIAIGFYPSDPATIPTAILNQNPRTAYAFGSEGSGYDPLGVCQGGSQDTWSNRPSEHEINVMACATNASFIGQGNGTYNTQFTNYLSNFIGPANDPLEVRYQNEWGAAKDCTYHQLNPFYNGNTTDTGTATNPGCAGNGSGIVSVANWVAAYANMAGILRANYPGLKTSLYEPYPQGYSLGNVGGNTFYNVEWWPPALTQYVDLVQIDVYFGGNSSAGEWQYAMSINSDGVSGNSGGLADGMIFAAMRGVPVAFDEFCDEYTDGYNLSRFLALISYLPVANAGYWDSTDDGTTTCPLDPTINNGSYTVFGQWFGTIGGRTYTYTNVYYHPIAY